MDNIYIGSHIPQIQGPSKLMVLTRKQLRSAVSNISDEEETVFWQKHSALFPVSAEQRKIFDALRANVHHVNLCNFVSILKEIYLAVA
jgi:hypothetical protein